MTRCTEIPYQQHPRVARPARYVCMNVIRQIRISVPARMLMQISFAPLSNCPTPHSLKEHTTS